MSNSLSRNANWQSLGRYPRLGRAEVPGLGAQYYQEPQPPQPRAQGCQPSTQWTRRPCLAAKSVTRRHIVQWTSALRYQSSGEVFAVRTYLLASMGTLPPLTSTQRIPIQEALELYQGHRVVLEVVKDHGLLPSSHPHHLDSGDFQKASGK